MSEYKDPRYYDKLEQQIDSGTCPHCEKQRLNVDEEGDQHTGMVCANCGAEVQIEYDLVPRSVTLFIAPRDDDEEATEILLYESSSE